MDEVLPNKCLTILSDKRDEEQSSYSVAGIKALKNRTLPRPKPIGRIIGVEPMARSRSYYDDLLIAIKWKKKTNDKL